MPLEDEPTRENVMFMGGVGKGRGVGGLGGRGEWGRKVRELGFELGRNDRGRRG